MIFFLQKKSKLHFKKNNQELEFELLNLLRKKFNLYAQSRIGQLRQTHVLKKIRREIAQVKFRLLKDNK